MIFFYLADNKLLLSNAIVACTACWFPTDIRKTWTLRGVWLICSRTSTDLTNASACTVLLYSPFVQSHPTIRATIIPASTTRSSICCCCWWPPCVCVCFFLDICKTCSFIFCATAILSLTHFPPRYCCVLISTTVVTEAKLHARTHARTPLPHSLR